MRIGVVSDTHGHVEFALPAVELLRQEDVEQVLHCGDIGSTGIVRLFADWPTHFVFGNTDDRRESLIDAMSELGHTCHHLFGDFELAGRRIALLHGHETWRLSELISCGNYDLVCSGHTHERKLQRCNGTTILNPGALHRARQHTIAIVDLATMDVDHQTVDAG
ncbi:YfcE family phosphodiesterase [bacterium]|nr:YfcE family phosphodiesterase [bacterium]